MTCVKKSFDSREEAQTFADNMAVKYGDVQEPYECPECGKFHNTSHPQGAYFARVNYEAAAASTTPEGVGLDWRTAAAIALYKSDTSPKVRGYSPHADVIAEWKRLRAVGVTYQSIAEMFGCTVQTIYNWLRDKTDAPKKRVSRSTTMLLDEEAIGVQEAQLRDQLARLEEARQRIREAKALKITQFPEHIKIEKEGNSITLSRQDWNEVIQQLMDILSAPEVSVQMQLQ